MLTQQTQPPTLLLFSGPLCLLVMLSTAVSLFVSNLIHWALHFQHLSPPILIHSIFLPWCSFSSVLLSFVCVFSHPFSWLFPLCCWLSFPDLGLNSSACLYTLSLSENFYNLHLVCPVFSIFKSNSWGFIIFGLTCPIPLLWYCGAICEYVGLDIISNLEELFGEGPIPFLKLILKARWSVQSMTTKQTSGFVSSFWHDVAWFMLCPSASPLFHSPFQVSFHFLSRFLSSSFLFWNMVYFINILFFKKYF